MNIDKKRNSRELSEEERKKAIASMVTAKATKPSPQSFYVPVTTFANVIENTITRCDVTTRGKLIPDRTGRKFEWRKKKKNKIKFQ